MGLLQGVKRLLGAVGRFWWRGMNQHANELLRGETEALERYRDISRGWRARESRPSDKTQFPCDEMRLPLKRPPFV